MKKKKLSPKISSPKVSTKNTQLILFLVLVIISAIVTSTITNSARQAEIFALRTPVVRQNEKKTTVVKTNNTSSGSLGVAGAGSANRTAERNTSIEKPTTNKNSNTNQATNTLQVTGTARLGNSERPAANTTPAVPTTTNTGNNGGSGATARDTARLQKDGNLRVPSLPAPAATTYSPSSGNGTQNPGGNTERRGIVHYDGAQPDPSKQPNPSKEPRSSKDPEAEVHEQMKKDAEKVKDNLENIQQQAQVVEQQAQQAARVVKSIVGPVVQTGVEVANSVVDIGQGAASIAVRQGGINTTKLVQLTGSVSDLAVNTANIPTRTGLYLGSLGARGAESAAQGVTSATNAVTNKVTNVTNAITGMAAYNAINMENASQNSNFGTPEERAQIAQGAELYRQLQEVGDTATERTTGVGESVANTTENIGEGAGELAGDLKDASKPKSFASQVASTITQPILNFFSGIADYVGGN